MPLSPALSAAIGLFSAIGTPARDPGRGAGKLFATISLSLAIGCAPAIDIHTLQSPSAHFDQYRTMAFDAGREAPAGYAKSQRSAAVRAYIRKTASEILRSRGYVVADPSQADLIWKIEVGRRPDTAPAGASIGMSPARGGPESADLLVAPPYHGYLDPEDRELVEGAFVIDAFDGKTRQLLWHGFARAAVQSDDVDYDRIHHAVESVLASFPASPVK